MAIWLIWTNAPEPDVKWQRFYAIAEGHTDTLKTDPFLVNGPIGARDSIKFQLPYVKSWRIWTEQADTAMNWSGPSNVVTMEVTR